MSPALRSIVGFLVDHPRFTVVSSTITGKFDNGEERSIDARRAHCRGTIAAQDFHLADIEGEVWMLVEDAGAEVLCSSTASVDAARLALKGRLPASSLMVFQ